MKNKQILQASVLCGMGNETVSIGYVLRLMVSRDKKRVESLLVRKNGETAIFMLPFDRLISVNSGAVNIFSADDLMSVEECDRLNDMLSAEIHVTGADLCDPRGAKIGAVDDFIFDVHTGSLTAFICDLSSGEKGVEIPVALIEQQNNRFIYRKEEARQENPLLIMQKQMGQIAAGIGEIKNLYTEMKRQIGEDHQKLEELSSQVAAIQRRELPASSESAIPQATDALRPANILLTDDYDSVLGRDASLVNDLEENLEQLYRLQEEKSSNLDRFSSILDFTNPLGKRESLILDDYAPSFLDEYIEHRRKGLIGTE